MSQVREEIFDTLTEIFQDIFDDDELALTEALSAADVEEWDSLSHIRLIVAIESELSLKFSVAELARLENVGQMVDLIMAKQA